MPLDVPASFTVQAGDCADRLTAPTLAHTHDPQVKEIPTLADLRARLGPASTQAAQHSKTMPQQIPVMPAHRSDRPASGPTRRPVSRPEAFGDDPIGRLSVPDRDDHVFAVAR